MKVTSDIHYKFILAAHVGFFSLVVGLIIRTLLGPLPFLVTFLLIQSLVVSAYLLIGVFNASALVQLFSLVQFQSPKF